MASYEQAKAFINNSVSRPTLYSMEITGKNIVGTSPTGGLNDFETEYFKLFCNNIELPGLDYEQITTIGQEAMGIQRSTPAGILFGAGNRMRFSAIESSDFTVYNSLRKLFEAAAAEGGNPYGNFRAQRMNYYNDYKFNVSVKKLEFPSREEDIPTFRGSVDEGYKVVGNFVFENCFISQIQPVTFDSTVQNTYLTFAATLRFENYFYENRQYMYGGEDLSSIPVEVFNREFARR